MNINKNLRKITEFGIGLTALSILALAGCGGSSSGTPVATSLVNVSTIAGSTKGVLDLIDSTGTSARFLSPNHIATDGTNLYVTDFKANNIRQIVISTGAVTTFAGSLTGVSGVTDNTGTNALFYEPNGIVYDTTTSALYVADSGNNTIRKITVPAGAVSTIAGTVNVAGTSDAAGTGASFYYPWGLTKIGTSLFVSDTFNCSIRTLEISNTTYNVATLVGPKCGYFNGASSVAAFNKPTDLTNASGVLYVTDSYSNNIRAINSTTGATSTFAGSNNIQPGTSDGIGASAQFSLPYGITNDGTYLYVTDTYNHTIRRISIASGAVITLAGIAGNSGTTDGPGLKSLFNYPEGIISISGVLYVADYNNGSIRKLQ